MSAAEIYLRRKEFSIGNGQCPECCGVPPSWLGHPLHRTQDTIGHKKDCDLAQAITSVGGSVVFIGEYKSFDFAPSYRENTVRGAAAKKLSEWSASCWDKNEAKLFEVLCK